MAGISFYKLLLGVSIILGGLVIFFALELIYIKFNGKAVAVPQIPRAPENYGSGRPLSYVVLGDSTAISQGGDYDRGYARESARFLGKYSLVTMRNFGISGARMEDVLKVQAPQAAAVKPDVVLIAAGANDVTHFSSSASVRSSLKSIAQQLRRTNPDVVILVTGAADMGSVPRFPEPIQSLAGVRTRQLNGVFEEVAREQNLVFVPIANKTGPEFRQHPELFAADKFHPDTDGYRLWTEVIVDTIKNDVVRKLP